MYGEAVLAVRIQMQTRSLVQSAVATKSLIVADGLCPRIGELLPSALHDLVALGHCHNPLRTISEELRHRRLKSQPVGTLHVVGHGRPGAIQIGGHWIDAASLMANADLLNQWQIGTIALWSCEVGADRGFVALLQELTGAKVAATSRRIEGMNLESWSVSAANDGTDSLPPIFNPSQLGTWPWSLAGFIDIAGQPLDFSVNDPSSAGDRRIAGSANTAGETWLYRNVITIDGQVVDAIVTFNSITSGTMTAFDSRSNPYSTSVLGGTPARFLQPNFNWNSSGGSATFRVRFIQGGSYSDGTNPKGTAVTLRNVIVNSYGLGSSSNSPTGSGGNRFISFADVDGLELSSSTELVVSVNGATTSFAPNPANIPGIITALPGTTTGDNYRVRVNFDEMSELTYTVGAGNGSGAAFYALDFSQGPRFTNVVSKDLVLTGGPLTTNESGTSATLSLQLSAQPSATVTVTLTGLDATEGSLSTTTLKFTTANWNSPRIVTVTGVDDIIHDGNITYTITAKSSSSDLAFNGRKALIDITNTDDDNPVTVTSPTVNEASPFVVFTVDGAFGQDVSLSLANGGSAASGADNNVTNTLEVSADNGNTWTAYSTGSVALNGNEGTLLVRVPILNVATFKGSTTFTLSATPTGGSATSGTATIVGDGAGTIFNPDGTTRNNAAKDVDRAVSVNSISVDEDAPFAAFSVSATESQSVSLAASFIDVAGQPLDFSVNDTSATGDRRIAGSANTAGETWLYRNVITIDGQVVDAIVTFNSITSGTMTAFDSTSNPYSTSALGGTPARFLQPNFNWNSSGGSASFTVGFIEGGSYSAGTNPSGTAVTLRNVFTNSYDLDSTSSSSSGNGGNQFTSFTDVGGIELSSSTALAVSVNGATTSFAPNPSSSPGNITALPGTTTGDNYRVRVSFDEVSQLTYTVGAGNGSGTAFYALDFSQGPAFTNVVSKDLVLTGGPLTTNESGTSATFSLQLSAQPSATVTVTLTGLDATEGSLSTTSLTFTTANWNSPQVVTVTGVNDVILDGNITYTITATSSSSDAAFNGRKAVIDITNIDNDGAISVDNISVNENSPFAVFTVSGTGNQPVTLALQNDANGATNDAALGTDTDTQIQYFNGSEWVDYSSGTVNLIDGSLLVRVAINDDNTFEGPETFQLAVTPTGGSLSTGTATILDDGTGNIYPDNNTGNIDPNATKDDDRGPAILVPTNDGKGLEVIGTEGDELWVDLSVVLANARKQNGLDLVRISSDGSQSRVGSIGATPDSGFLGDTRVKLAVGDQLQFIQVSSELPANDSPALSISSDGERLVVRLDDNRDDNDFNDLVLKVKTSTFDPFSQSTKLAKFQQASDQAYLDLSWISANGIVLSMDVTTDSDFNNRFGLVKVDTDANGTPLGTVGGLAPSAGADFDEAVRRNLLSFSYTQSGKQTVAGLSVALQGSQAGVYAPVLITPTGAIYTFGASSSSDQKQHIKVLGANSFGFEDLPSGSADWDFNDAVITFQATNVEPPKLVISSDGQGLTVVAGTGQGTGLWLDLNAVIANSALQNSFDLVKRLANGQETSIGSVGATAQATFLGGKELFLGVGETLRFVQNSNDDNENVDPALRIEKIGERYRVSLDDNGDPRPDSDFNDLIVDVDSTPLDPFESVVSLASQQRTSSDGILDLTNLQEGKLTLNLSIVTDSENINTLSFVKLDVDPVTGKPLSQVAGVSASEGEAFRTAVRDNLVDFSIAAGGQAKSLATWEVGASDSGYYAAVVVSFEGNLFTLGDTTAADGRQHLKVFGDNTFGFEDLLSSGGADWDYNDLIVTVTPF